MEPSTQPTSSPDDATLLPQDATTLQLSAPTNNITVSYINKQVWFSVTGLMQRFQQLGWTTKQATPPNTIAIVFTYGEGVTGLQQSTCTCISFPDLYPTGAKASVVAPDSVGIDTCHFELLTPDGADTLVDPIIVITVKP